LIISNNIFYQLARVVGLARPQAGDADLTLPPVIFNVLTIPLPLDETSLPPSADIQRGTTHTFATASVFNAGVAISATLANLIAGMWRFNVLGSMSSNYAPPVGLTAFTAWIELVYGNGQIFLCGMNSGGSAASPTVYSVVREVEILVPVQSTIRVQVQTNLAGQTCTASFDVFATRLF